MKILVPSLKYLLVTQTIQAVVITLGCSPEPDDETLLLKIKQNLLKRHRESMLGLT